MKKRIAAVLLLALLAGVFPAVRAETSGTGLRSGEIISIPVSGDVLRTGDFLYRVLEDGSAELVDYLGEDDLREIPGEIAGRRLTSLGDRCFSNLGNMNYYTDDYPDYHREYVRSLRVPEGVVSIGAYAFEQCFNLTDVTLPGSLRRIGEGAFDGCDSLMKADLPEGLLELGSYAFRDCRSLTGISIPGSLRSIGANPFAGCGRLTRIGVSPSHAFLRYENGMLFDTAERKLICCTAECGGSRAELPEGLRAIGDAALADAAFEEVVLPDSLEEIGSYAFSGCAFLRALAIPGNVKVLGENPFRGCVSLKAPAFSDLQDRFVVRGGMLLDLDKEKLVAWLDLPALPEAQTIYSSEPDGLSKEIGVNGTQMRLVTSSWTYFADEEKEPRGGVCTVPDGIREIGAYAFFQSDLASVILPDSVRAVGSGAFADCAALREIRLPAAVREIPDRLFCGCEAMKEVLLPEGTVSVGEFAFARSGIEGIRLPDSVRALGQYAFTYCGSLRNVRLSENLAEIARGTFSFSGVEKLVIPESVETIGAEAFAGCACLYDVVLPSGLTAVPEFCFYDSCIGEIAIPSGVAYIGDHAFRTGEYNSSCLYRIDLPDNVLFLGNFAFSGGAFEEVTVPGSVVAMGRGVFNRCMALTKAVLRDGLAVIGDGMFCYSSLESVRIPDSVTAIGAAAFADCRLQAVFLPDSVTYIGNEAFFGCDRLTAVRLPSGKTEFGGNPFGACPELKDVQLDADHPNLSLSDGFLTDVPARRIVSYLPRAGQAGCAVPVGIETIGADAFALADLSGGITLPESLRAIEAGAFDSAALKEIRLPDGVESIGDRAFAGTGLTGISLPGSLVTIGSGAFEDTGIMEYRLPESVERIGDGAFGTGAERIVFSGSPVRLGRFTRFGKSPEIVLPADHPTLELSGGNLYSREDRRLIALLTDEPILPGTRIIEEKALGSHIAVVPESVELIRIYGLDWWWGWANRVYVVPGSPAEAFFESHLSY